MEKRKQHLVRINQRKVYNISFTNLKSFSLWPTFPRPMLLASPAVPQTQETRTVYASTLLPNELISNFNVFNNIKITVHYSVHMRISGEKVRISDEAERVQSISYSHIRSLSGF